jgi:protein TonB
LLAIVSIIYTFILSSRSVVELDVYRKIVFNPVNFQQINQETEKFFTPPAPPPIQKQTSDIPKIVENDTIIETEKIIENDPQTGTIDTAQIEPGDGETGESDENGQGDEIKDGDIFLIVEKMPVPPGGELGLRRYIASHIKYPPIAIERGIEGLVYIKFCITSKGDVEKVSVIQGADPILDKEALRVIRSLPKWTPGEQRGKKVNVWYTVPINFDLGK